MASKRNRGLDDQAFATEPDVEFSDGTALPGGVPLGSAPKKAPKRRSLATAFDLDDGKRPPRLKGADELSAGLLAHPEHTLAHHNLAPSLRSSRWNFAVLRTSVTPQIGSTIDPALTTAPFTTLRGLGGLATVIGVADVHRHVTASMAQLRAVGAAPLAVFVPVALEDDLAAPPELQGQGQQGPAVTDAASLREMLWVPETGCGSSGGAVDSDGGVGAPYEAAAGGGWLMTEERWENRLGSLPTRTHKHLYGIELRTALLSHPHLTLAAAIGGEGGGHGAAAPPLTPERISTIIIRTATLPQPHSAADTSAGGGGPLPESSSWILDPALCSAPFFHGVAPPELVPVLGMASAQFHVARAINDAKASSGSPLPVLVPLRVATGGAAGGDAAGPTLVQLLFVADRTGMGGWVISPERWSGRITLSNLNESQLLFGPALYEALAEHPNLTLEAYNAAPDAAPASAAGLTAEKLPNIILRTAAPPVPGGAASAAAEEEGSHGGSGAAAAAVSATPVIDAASTSAPFSMTSRLDSLRPVLGVSAVRYFLRRAADALRGAGAAPLPVLVPLALRGSGGVQRGEGEHQQQQLQRGKGGLGFQFEDEEEAGGGGGVGGDGAAAAALVTETRDPAAAAAAAPAVAGAAEASDPGGEILPVALHEMLWMPDAPVLSSDAPSGSGWVVSRARWEAAGRGGLAEHVSTGSRFPVGSALGVALAAHPELTLEAYNAAPTLTAAKTAFVSLRYGARPAPGSSIDPTLATAPFTATQNLRALLPVLGVADVRRQLAGPVKALVSAGTAPAQVFVPLAVRAEAPRARASSAAGRRRRAASGGAAAAAAALAAAGGLPVGGAGGDDDDDGALQLAAALLRPMLFIPDLKDAASGWLFAPQRWAKEELAARTATLASESESAAQPLAAAAAAAVSGNGQGAVEGAATAAAAPLGGLPGHYQPHLEDGSVTL